MSLKTILFAGLTAASLASPALVTSAQANDDSYWCNDHRCYDDQAEETRRLNRLQAQHPAPAFARYRGTMVKTMTTTIAPTMMATTTIGTAIIAGTIAAVMGTASATTIAA